MIMNNKSIRVLTFVCLLTTIVLLSLIIGSNLLAKPNNPNKPDNPGEHDTDPGADFKIWIGNGDLGSPEDVFLQPYDGKDYLLKEDWPYGTRGWLPSTKKGKNQSVDWGIRLYKEGYPGQSDYCGTYIIANKLGGPGYEEVALLDTMLANGFSSYLELFCFNLYHYVLGPESRGDYWNLGIVWKVEDSGGLWLAGNTNKDTEWEGVYDYNADTWTVPFDSVWFELFMSINDEHTTLWEGPLSFTVEIQRTLNN